MAAIQRTDDSRTLATRTALIEAAESLFAERGINGVSLRQIGAASGSANSSVISYHFGSRDALLRAVIDHRLPAIEARRGELLARAQAASRSAELTVLVDVMFRPLFEQTDAGGRRSYAAFLAELVRSDSLGVRDALSARFPITREVVSRIEQAIPVAAVPRFPHRMALASALIFAALRNIDHARPAAAEAQGLFGDAIAAASAVFSAAAPQPHAIENREEPLP